MRNPKGAANVLCTLRPRETDLRHGRTFANQQASGELNLGRTQPFQRGASDHCGLIKSAFPPLRRM
jgi:hypothetical protein